MMVQVGFWQAAETKPAPSTTNRFFTSCDCRKRIEHGRFRVGAHARGAELVDRRPLGQRIAVDPADLKPQLANASCMLATMSAHIFFSLSPYL